MYLATELNIIELFSEDALNEGSVLGCSIKVVDDRGIIQDWVTQSLLVTAWETNMTQRPVITK